jgi:hypothetical protein
LAKSSRQDGPIKAQSGWWKAAFRVSPADVVKALPDCAETRFDHRLKFEVPVKP